MYLFYSACQQANSTLVKHVLQIYVKTRTKDMCAQLVEFFFPEACAKILHGAMEIRHEFKQGVLELEAIMETVKNRYVSFVVNQLTRRKRDPILLYIREKIEDIRMLVSTSHLFEADTTGILQKLRNNNETFEDMLLHAIRWRKQTDYKFPMSREMIYKVAPVFDHKRNLLILTPGIIRAFRMHALMPAYHAWGTAGFVIAHEIAHALLVHLRTGNSLDDLKLNHFII